MKCGCGAELACYEAEMCCRCRALLDSIPLPSGRVHKPEWMWRMLMKLLPANLQN